MPHLAIKIHRHNDPDPAFPVNPDDIAGTLEFQNCSVMESGMQSGRTSLFFGLQDAAGKWYFVETSAGMIDMLAACIKGAEANWLENPVPNIWKGK